MSTFLTPRHSLFPFEVISIIVENLSDDLATLHSCMLTNRQWFNASVAVVYRAPYSPSNDYNTGPVEVYLTSLLQEDKETLVAHGIHLPASKLTVDYVSFTREIVDSVLYKRLEEWLCNEDMSEHTDLLFSRMMNMFVRKCRLRSLNTCMYQKKINVEGPSDWLSDVARYQHDLNKLSVKLLCASPKEQNDMNDKVASIIKKQKSLREFSLFAFGPCVNPIMDALKQHSRTLEKVQLGGCTVLEYSVSEFLNTFKNIKKTIHSLLLWN